MSLLSVISDLCSDHPASDPRWWLVLVGQLPSDSALSAALLGGREHRGWTVEAYLLAAAVDALQVNTTVTARSAGSKRFPVPQPVWRPGQRASRAKGRPLSSLLPSRRRPPGGAPSQRAG